jgi:hypothetical protein
LQEYGWQADVSQNIIERFLPLATPNENDHDFLIIDGFWLGYTGWIPTGLFNDLIENNRYQVRDGIWDDASGYTNKMIYDAMDNNVESPQQFRLRLLFNK